MIALGPKRSSQRPETMVEMPAMRFAATPKMTMSMNPKPNTWLAMTAPNANTPASPSRKTALESRNQKVLRVAGL